MNNSVDRSNGHGVGISWLGVVVDVKVRGEGIEDLAGIGDVCLEGVDRGMREGR